jgi:Ca2+/Na+ antiporter
MRLTMDINNQNEIKKFDFKMDKIERYLSFVMLGIFFLSFREKFGVWTFLLYSVTALIFVYYFIWYRKKTFYVLVEDDSIIIHPPLFFKQHEIKRGEINHVKVFDKKVEIGYSNQGIDKSINVYSLILKVEDWEQMKHILEQMDQ